MVLWQPRGFLRGKCIVTHISLVQVVDGTDCGEGGPGARGRGGGLRGGGWGALAEGKTSILQTEAFKTFDLHPKRSLRKLQNEANGPWRINNMTLAYLQHDMGKLRLTPIAVC
jgi:hypothetical protein